MSRALYLLLCFSSLALAQTFNRSQPASTPSSAVQVFYVVDGSTLTTYNIDPQTLEPSAVGTTTLPLSQYPSLVTSPNGQFLYYLANDNSKGEKLYVYDTNAMGVPPSAPVQVISTSELEGLSVNPVGRFLYLVAVAPLQQYMTQYTIVRNVIDPATGKLSQPMTEATYQLDAYPSGNDCYLSILGFNPAGTVMYDGIFCSGPHGSGSSTYNQRSVDLQTGALGPDQQIYAFSYYAGSGNANVQMQNNLMFAFVSYENQGPNANLVDVYQLPDVTTPTVNCTASMWVVCGSFGYALAHPSGEYVFLQDSSGLTDIGQVNLETQQIAEVSSLPYEVRIFSPDGRIAYGTNSTTQAKIRIAGFNSASGEVKLGGIIQMPRALDYWTAAERY